MKILRVEEWISEVSQRTGIIYKNWEFHKLIELDVKIGDAKII